MAASDVEMEAAAMAAGRFPFQLQFDKPIPFQVKIAEWNPEKDLLAMVTDDSKLLLHRFNWQRLWNLSPGKCITSLSWRPDGKALALGLEDGSISLHDVENGKLLRTIKYHNVAIICLNWQEDTQLMSENYDCLFTYEDRTTRFFPPPPRIPRLPGLSSGDNGLTDEPEDSFQELSNSSRQRFNILCSADKDGSICFSIFGIFPIAKINMHQLCIFCQTMDGKSSYCLYNASIFKVTLSKNLCKLVVVTCGGLVEVSDDADRKTASQDRHENGNSSLDSSSSMGVHSLLLNTSIFLDRKNELHQVAQQASSIEDLLEVIRVSLSLMSKQWSDAMHLFHDKFDHLASLIVDNGIESNPREEFLSLFCGARTSPALHQFLVNSLGEVGLKRVSKAIDGAGKELNLVIGEHLQPAVEVVGFRVGELRGLSRWRVRYQSIGLDEQLFDEATENAGMLLVQVERFSRVLTTVLYMFQNFLIWVLKCIKILMSEPTDQIQPYNSELVIVFLKFLLDHDPVGQLLELSELSHPTATDLDTIQRLEELVVFGGFSDTRFLERSLAKEFGFFEQRFKEAFLMPFTTISKKITCEDLFPMYPISPSLCSSPASMSYYDGSHYSAFDCHASQDSMLDYICFRVPDESLGMQNLICILRGFTNRTSFKNREALLEGVLLHIPKQYCCVDLSLYKESQIVLLLNEATSNFEKPERSLIMLVSASGLAFQSLPRASNANFWRLNELKGSAIDLLLECGKVRWIPTSLTVPLAVSTSRGVACVFTSRRRHAMVYILDEDEDEASDEE